MKRGTFWFFLASSSLVVVLVFSGCASSSGVWSMGKKPEVKAKTTTKVKCVKSDLVPFGSSICTPVDPNAVSIKTVGQDEGIIFTVEE